MSTVESEQAREPDVEEPFDGSNPAHVSQRQRRANVRDEMRREGLRRVMAEPEGRAFMFALFEHAPMLGECADMRSSSQTYYSLGRVSVTKEIYRQIAEAGLEPQWFQMNREGNAPVATNLKKATS